MDSDHTITLRLSDDKLLKNQLVGKTKENVVVYNGSQVSVMPAGNIGSL
jgi:hypothetical protein